MSELSKLHHGDVSRLLRDRAPGCPPVARNRYLELYEGRAYLRSGEAKPLRQQVAALAKEYGVRDRRQNPLDGTQHDQQLALAV